MRERLFCLSASVLLLGLVGNVFGQIATNPTPPDGALHANTWVGLSWTGGDTAASHNVYLGENLADVAAGTGGTFRGNHNTTNLIVGYGLEGLPYPDGLVPHTTYYWRVDELEADGTKHKGNVWSFSIAPKTAYDPDPADGAKFVDPNVTLSWTKGIGARLHYLYFGGNYADVEAGTGGTSKGPKASTTYTPGILTKDTTYYWRVDENDGTDTHKGKVWSFSTLGDIIVTDPNLVGWWKLDRGFGTTALDWSGHGNHGTLFSGPQWVAGYDGGAVHFDGLDDYIAIQNLHYASASGLTGVTVCAWVRTSNSDIQAIASFDRNEYWRLEVNGNGGGPGQIGWSVWTSTGQVDCGSVTRVDDGQWHHVAAIFDNGTLTVYVDGKPEPSVTGGSTFGRGRNIRYGFISSRSEADEFNGGGATRYSFDGDIDDVRIYDKTLTPEGIKLVMRGDLTLAWDPDPADGSVPNIKDVTSLGWSAGDKASQHYVYFGTDRDAVADADTSDTTGIYRGRQGGTSYTPPEGVEWGGGPYYWRIDEYNTDGTTTKGRVWRFTVADYLVVDDFELYNDLDPGDPDSNRIFAKWSDGWGTQTNGARVGYSDPNWLAGEHFVETTTVHGGTQSMPYSYNNNFKYSEASMTLSYPRDWTEQGVEALSLWFHGDPNNDPERMYVVIEDSGGTTAPVPYPGDVRDVSRASWHEWNIDLRQFGDVTLNSIDKIFIGFGTRGDTSKPGGSGTVFFDDVRLYRPRCVPSLRKPSGDLNDDCAVDRLDIEVMAADWLKTDFVVSTVDPGSAGLLVHYRFDGDTNDSSGNGNHGDPNGGPTFVSGKFGQAISLDGVDDYVAIENLTYVGANHTEVSVCAWIRTSSSIDQRIASFDRNEYWRLAIAGEGAGPGQVAWDLMTSAGQVDSGSSKRVDDGQWHHVAAVFDNGTLTIYIDSRPEPSVSGGPTFGSATTRYGFLGTGSEADVFDGAQNPNTLFIGDLDEVRIYERALSEAEIAYLADESPGDGELYVPVPSVANMYDEEPPLSRSVNLRDFAVFAESWLDEQLWPAP